jgi:hypothetical protein
MLVRIAAMADEVPLKVCAAVNVCVVPKPATVALAAGNVIVVLSVPASVMLLFAVSVFPSATVSVDPVAGVVSATLLIVVAEATPRVGVVRLGDVANTSKPEPVSSVTAAAKLALDGVDKNVATPVPRPLTPVAMGRPVTLVISPLAGVPKAGVVSDGDVANTKAPEPVSSVTAAAKLALDGVARKVATPVPRPLTPVAMGRPVTLVISPLAGVPSAGVVSDGDVANTKAPEPVSFVTAAAKLALDGVAKNVATPVPRPLTPVAMGRPVTLVISPLVGVPSAGVVSDGDVARATTVPVPVVV